jgi:hypothetical protein
MTKMVVKYIEQASPIIGRVVLFPMNSTQFAARTRWYWIPPLYSVTLLFALMVTIARGTATAQFMYGNF